MEMKIRAWRWMVPAVLWGAMGGSMAGAPGEPTPAAPGAPSGWEAGVAVFGALEGASARDARHERDTLQIVEDETLLAVVIRTTGLAARFAPDHLIHASEYDLLLVLDPEAPEEARFTASIPVARLVVDDHTVKREVEDRLLELAILEDPYDEMSEDDRESVRASMLAEDQLDADRHPSIEVEAVSISSSGEDDFPWTVTGALTVRGVRVEAPLRARMERDGNRIRIEAFGAFRFTDLGIEPFSAFLGAVRNRDEFHLYMDLVARDASEATVYRIRPTPSVRCRVSIRRRRRPVHRPRRAPDGPEQDRWRGP